MDRDFIKKTLGWAQGERERSLDFWLRYGLDKEHGGIQTCLDAKGQRFSTDKSIWMQGRAAYSFAAACQQVGLREDYLAASKSCLDFLEKHGINHEAKGRMYFTVTADGRPLRQRRYWFSEAFYAMANAQYHGLTQDKDALLRARKAYEMIWQLFRGFMDDPTGLGAKTIREIRSTRGLAGPMIYLNLSSVMKEHDPEYTALYDERADQCVRDIFDFHVKEELKATLEEVYEDGSFMPEITAGRVVNPGHVIECAWFIMDHARSQEDEAQIAKAFTMMQWALEAGWDERFGGLLYFVDCLGQPTEAYEHDMKLWWPHTEALIACLLAYQLSQDSPSLAQMPEAKAALPWFKKVKAYCQKHFIVDKQGEWLGYLRRDGQPTEPPIKGGTFKGPFHVPRAMLRVEAICQELLKNERQTSL